MAESKPPPTTKIVKMSVFVVVLFCLCPVGG